MSPAAALTAGLVLHPAVLPTYLTTRLAQPDPASHQVAANSGALGRALGDRDLERMPFEVRRGEREFARILKAAGDATSWAVTFAPALEEPDFNKLVRETTRAAVPVLAARNPLEAPILGGSAPALDRAPHMVAFLAGRRALALPGNEARWTALIVFTLSRVIAVMANQRFAADAASWSEESLAFFDAERMLLAGDGPTLARHVVTMNKKHLDGRLAQVLAERIAHGGLRRLRSRHWTQSSSQICAMTPYRNVT